MTLTLTAVQALRLSYLISVGKENTDQQDIKDVADEVQSQIQQLVEDLSKAIKSNQ
jgi:hypothetical protein